MQKNIKNINEVSCILPGSYKVSLGKPGQPAFVQPVRKKHIWNLPGNIHFGSLKQNMDNYKQLKFMKQT